MRRLSPGTLIILVFAILLGLLGAYAAKRFLTREAPPVVAAPAPPPEKTYQVPVAVSDLPVGRIVSEDDVAVLRLRAEDIVKAKFPKVWMENVKQITGRTLREAHKMGLPFGPSSFFPKGMGPNLAESLKPGERAVTIPLPKEGLAGTFITPGSIIDVLFRATPDARSAVPDATVTLLSRVRVLAIDANLVEGARVNEADKGKEAATPAQTTPTITLAVNQTQAQAIKVVEGRGTMSLALRNPKDDLLAEKKGPTTFPGLLGLKDPPKPFVSEIYRRGARSAMTFLDDQRQKMSVDPPYGMPVLDSPKDDKKNGIEVWFPYNNWGGWGGNNGAGWGGGWGSGRGTYAPGFGPNEGYW